MASTARALKTPANAETVETVIEQMDKRREDNLRIWKALGRTDPAHTKQFSRAGGFKGTAIKPIWITQRLTEQFGPCGVGWGIDEPQFQVVAGDNREMLVYCTVSCWHGTPTNKLYGVGGDKVVTHIKANPQYNRAERWENDDEAFKKAFTDAVNNAFKFVGVGADVHMGLFDDSKYVREVAEEFHPKPDETGEPKPGKRLPTDMSDTQLRGCIKTLIHNCNGCGSLRDFEELLELQEVKDTIEQCARRFPAWYETGEGLPAEFKPLKKIIEETRAGLAQLEETE
jgi:hypothetical protein